MRKNNISLYKFPENAVPEQQQPPLQQPSQQQPLINGVTANDFLTNGKPQQNGNNNSAPSDLSKRLPFAIVGSTHIKEILVGGEQRATKHRVRVREYPWGTVEVDNLAHNDFMALRDMIIKNNLIDLIDVGSFLNYSANIDGSLFNGHTFIHNGKPKLKSKHHKDKFVELLKGEGTDQGCADTF